MTTHSLLAGLCMLLIAGCTSATKQQSTALPRVLAINCGASTDVVDADAKRWLPDRGFYDGVASPSIGTPGDDAALPAVCQSERYGMSGFWMPLANGQYRVCLTFCESYSAVTAAGQRVFNVDVEGVPLRDVDPYRDGGGLRKASVRQVEVTVRDGKLDIRFEAVKQSPQVNAIEIIAIQDDGETTAPTGFDQPRNVPHGRITPVTYPSRTLGYDRPANIYTPPGYDPKEKYPVLLLLHGGPGDGNSWKGWNDEGRAATIMDNLIADGKAVPMILVMPLGTLQPDGRATSRPAGVEDPKHRHMAFERDIISDLLPYVQSHYSVHTEASYRALAGFSMGGGQVGWIGPRNTDTFAYLGMFSSGLLGTAGDVVRDNFPEGKDINPNLKLLWVSVGKRDRYYPGVLRLVSLLDAKQIHYRWQLQEGSHDWPVWREALYLFAPRLFH